MVCVLSMSLMGFEYFFPMVATFRFLLAWVFLATLFGMVLKETKQNPGSILGFLIWVCLASRVKPCFGLSQLPWFWRCSRGLLPLKNPENPEITNPNQEWSYGCQGPRNGPPQSQYRRVATKRLQKGATKGFLSEHGLWGIPFWGGAWQP